MDQIPPPTGVPVPAFPPEPPRRLHFGVVLLLSLLLFNGGFILSLGLSWTEHSEGFLMGLRGSVIWSVAWCLTALPWALVWLTASKRSPLIARFLNPLTLAPPALIFVVLTGTTILQPNDAASRFNRLSGATFPAEARNLRFHSMSLFDRSDTWYFETDAREIDRLVSAMKLDPKEFNGGITEEGIRFNTLGLRPPSGWPDFHRWPDIKAYQRHDEIRKEFLSLLTDRGKTRAYIRISTY